MLKFVPDVYAQSVYTINYDKLKRQGIKCLIFDLDNTLEPYANVEPTKKVIELITFLKTDFKVIIMSNNNKERVRPFKEKLNIDSAHSSKKPFKKKYKKIMEMFSLKETEVACIGDQIITDVLGANRMGMISIFVNSISESTPLVTKINRYIEKQVLRILEKKEILIRGNYYD